jgi:hypothetical protein
MPGEPIGAGGLVGSALRAISEGASANRWLAALREAGAGVRREVGLRVYGQAKTLAAEYESEPTRPLDQAPTFSEMRQWPTRASSGVLQTVQLFYRENMTGRIVQRFYNVRTDEGISRQEAIDAAIDANAEGAEEYEQVLVGAVHTGAAILVADTAA